VKPPKRPQYVPADVAYAVFAMWASLGLSAAFAAYEFLTSLSILYPMVRLFIFGAYILAIKAITQKNNWSRYAAVLLTVLFYASLAFDADGLTRTDLWHLIAKTPIDIFVITRLFKPSVTKWMVLK